MGASLGGTAGGLLGGPAGVPLGASVGTLAADAFKTITGYGDYSVKKNSLVMGAPPSVHNRTRAGGAVFISHKEYIADILSDATANTFKIQKFPIQPGNSLTFPWLSQVAANFQEYRFHGVVFHFRSMSADALNSTNTALGQVIMSTEYNSAAPDFASKPEMENAQYSNSIKPSDSCLHLIECARASSVLSNLYVRTDDVDTSSEDVRFYDLGNFFIASNGCQGTSVNLGELWVSYEVELLKPKIWGELGETNDYFNAYTVTGVTNALPLGTAALVSSDNSNIDVSLSSQTLTLPPSSTPKSYFMYLYWRGTRTASLDPPATTFTNAVTTFKPFVVNGSLNEQATTVSPDSNAASSSTTLIDMIAFETSGNGKIPTIAFGAAGVLPASVTLFQIIITQVPNTYAFTA